MTCPGCLQTICKLHNEPGFGACLHAASNLACDEHAIKSLQCFTRNQGWRSHRKHIYKTSTESTWPFLSTLGLGGDCYSYSYQEPTS